MLKVISIIIGVLIVGWFLVSRFSSSTPDVVSRNGLHWHAELSINILGQSQEIPAGLGLAGLPHNPLHTHDRDSVIHLEFEGKVTANDLRLGKFFQIWGKQFNKDCIFEYCTNKGILKMYVNGKENFDFEKYFMQDGDEILIEYAPKLN